MICWYSSHLRKFNSLPIYAEWIFLNFINWTSQFQFLGLLGCISQFYSNFDRAFCNNTVETLIRRRFMRRLIRVCTVCLCSITRTLGLYGLKARVQLDSGTRSLNINLGLYSLHHSLWLRAAMTLVRLCQDAQIGLSFEYSTMF